MNKSELVTKLELVGRALSDQDLVPMFKCFAFDGKNVSAYNDSLGIISPCEIGTFALNGNTLLGLLKNSHSEGVELLADKEDVTVKAGKSRFKLPYFTEDEFLFKEPKDKWHSSIPINESLLRGLEVCRSMASTDLAQPAFLGVSLQFKGNITLYSTNGDAIARFITSCKCGEAEPCFIPNAFCDALVRIMSDTKAEKGTINISKEWIKAGIDTGYTIYGRLIEITNPLDYEAEINNVLKHKPEFVPVPKGLDHALSRARVIADAESAKTSLSIVDGKLSLHTETHQGVVRDVLPYGKVSDTTADVSAEYVQRALGLSTEMSILEDWTVYRDEKSLFLVVSNLGS